MPEIGWTKSDERKLEHARDVAIGALMAAPLSDPFYAAQQLIEWEGVAVYDGPWAEQ